MFTNAVCAIEQTTPNTCNGDGLCVNITPTPTPVPTFTAIQAICIPTGTPA